MTPGDRRPHRAPAVVGLLVGLVLLLGAVVDGGFGAPTRTGPDRVTAAVPHGDTTAATVMSREDLPVWAQILPPSPGAVVLLASLVGLLGLAVALPPRPFAGPGRRCPALHAARHRGPPVLV